MSKVTDRRLLTDILNFLRPFNRYSSIIDNIENANPLSDSFIFEALFAYSFKQHGFLLDYEVNINPQNNFTVDFVYPGADDSRLCFELVSPNMSDMLASQCAPRETGTNGITSWEVALDGSHFNKYLRPQAQTIRMQEKLLGKVCKFPAPSDDIFSTIVVDCSNFHFGHWDGEDCRMAMFGRTQNQFLQEYWQGNPIQGLLEEINNRRGSEKFRNRITSVIFIPVVSPETSIYLLDTAFIVLNELRSEQHLKYFWGKLRDSDIYRKIKYVPRPDGQLL